MRDTTTTADLCLHSARHLLDGLSLRPEDLDGLILVTQTPDYSSPSTAIGLQHRLGMRTDTLGFDMRLGCSGFVYGLSVAYSLVESGLRRILLCVGDVASRMVAKDDRAITPIMCDAGAAAPIERRATESVFQLHSDTPESRRRQASHRDAIRIRRPKFSLDLGHNLWVPGSIFWTGHLTRCLEGWASV